MKKYGFLLVLLLLPSVVLAQGGRRGGRMGPGGAQRNIVEVIINQKAELELTAAQIASLEPIAKKLDEQNKPVLEELQKLRGSGTNPREMSEEQRAQLRPLMEKMREHREAALKEAQLVLTDAQKEKLRNLLQERREGRGARGLRR
jgi:hypothetical protein